MLTVAQPDILFFFHFEFQGSDARSFVHTAAKRLIGTQSAGTPEIGAGFKGHHGGLFIKNFWFGHVVDI